MSKQKFIGSFYIENYTLGGSNHCRIWQILDLIGSQYALCAVVWHSSLVSPYGLEIDDYEPSVFDAGELLGGLVERKEPLYASMEDAFDSVPSRWEEATP